MVGLKNDLSPVLHQAITWIKTGFRQSLEPVEPVKF